MWLVSSCFLRPRSARVVASSTGSITLAGGELGIFCCIVFEQWAVDPGYVLRFFFWGDYTIAQFFSDYNTANIRIPTNQSIQWNVISRVCGFVAHVKVNQIHSLLEAIFAFWRSYKLKLTQVEGCSPMQAWDIPESTGCTELESDAESSIQYQDLTSIWLSATSIYLFFSPFFFPTRKPNKQNC